MTVPFHYAFQVKSLGITKMFYCEILGCAQGRITEDYAEFDFYGHHITAHLCADMEPEEKITRLNGIEIPMPHFGAILQKNDWDSLAEKLVAAGIEFILEPQLFHKNEIGEHSVMVIKDPSGNALEFLSYTHPEEIFQK